MAEAVVARLKAVLSGDSSQLKRDLDKATRNLDEFGKKAQRAGRQMTMRLTLPIVGAGAAAVKTASDFEKSMSKITALVGVAADEVASMEGAVRSMATQFGKSATEAADALFFITSAGLRGSVATDTLAASLKASAIGLGETATIADLATSALNAYGADTISASQATDVLTAAVREGKLEAGELAGSMGRVLPLSSAMGVSFNEVGAAFAALSRTGTNAAEAATQIRGILSSLLRPTKQSEEAMAGLGLSAEGLRTQIREEGLLSTLKTLAEEFEGNEAAAAAVFGNIRALSGVLDLMGANVATTEQIFANMADTTGTVDEAFSVMSETASFKFAQAMAELKEVLLTIGEEVMPMVASVVESLGGALSGLADFIKGLPEPVKNAAVGLVAFAAAAGPAALGIGAISTAASLLMANPMIAGGAVIFGAIAAALAVTAGDASRARDRQEQLNEEMRKAGDPAATLIDDMAELAARYRDVESAASGTADAVQEFAGRETMVSALVDKDALNLVRDLGIDMDTLTDAALSGGHAIGQLRGKFKEFDDQNSDVIDGIAVQNNSIGEMARTFRDLAQSGEVTVHELKVILDAMDSVSDAARKNRDDLDDLAEQYLRTQAFEDFAHVLGVDVVESYIAAGEKHGFYADALDELRQLAKDFVPAASFMNAEILQSAFVADRAAVAMSNAAPSVDTLAHALVQAGDMAGYDIRQIAGLVDGLNVLDSLSPDVRVQLGLDVMGGEAILDLIDDLIKLQLESMPAISPDAGQFGFGGAIGGLMKLRDSLAAALSEPSGTSGGGFGGGGGGSSTPASEAIDEVARAAEEAQRQADDLSRAVANLGNSLMGRDFAEELFGASPDEIADIFEKLVGQLDELGLVTEENAPTIAALGEQFKAAASAAEELAQATADLAEAQDVLDQKRQVVKDIQDDYKDFRDEFFTPVRDDGLVGILGGRGSGLDLIVEQLETALPKLREAQNKFQNLLAQRDQYKQSVADLFRPQLSADGNVMAQTQRLLGQARQFRDNIIALRDKGFPPDVIAEVVNAGLQGGAKLGSQLLRMGTGEMSQFLSMREEIARLGAQTSKVAADVLFRADIGDARKEFTDQRRLVDQLFRSAVAEAQKQANDQEKVVNGLKEALEAATAQMEQLVNNIQVNLFNAFNNFLSKIGGEVTTLTATPYSLDVDLSAIDRLANMIADLTGTPAPTPVNPTPLKPKPGDNGKRPPKPGEKGPIPRPTPEQTYTVKSGDGPYRIIQALTGSASGWASKGKKLWQHNGLFWNSSSDWQTIHPGMVLRVPALANGGYARKGMPHLVGEMGAELFVPDSSGYVVPNHALGGGSQTVNVTINTHAGMRAEDIVREIEKYTRRRGQVSIPTTGNRRF